MTRGLPKLERAIRDRVRAEVRQSEALWQEYVRRRRHPIRVALEAFAAILGVPLFVAILLGMADGPLLAGLAICRDHPGLLAPLETRFPLECFLHALCLTGSTLAFAGLLNLTTWRSRTLAVEAFLPVADAEHYERAFVQVLRFGGILFAAAALLGYGYWALQFDFGLVGCEAAFGLALVQGGVVAAMVLLLQGSLVFPDRIGLLGLMLLLCSYMGMGAILSDMPLEGRTWLGMAFMPAGWVNLAFKIALVERNPAGWLWLLPAALVIALALRRQRQPFAIREYVFHKSAKKIGEAEAIPEACCISFKGRRLFRLIGQAAEEPPARQLMAARHAKPGVAETGEPPPLRIGALWDGVPRDPRGWLERFIFARLTPRERDIMSCMPLAAPRRAAWTWWWCWFCLSNFVALAILALPWPQEVLLSEGSPVKTLLVFPFLAFLLFGPAVTTTRLIEPQCWLPIGEDEMTHLLWKIHLSAVMFAAPVALAAGALAGWWCFSSARAGLGLAALTIYTGVALFPLRFLWGAVQASNGETSLRQLCNLFVVIGIMGATFAGSASTFQWTRPWLAVLGAVSLPLISFGSWGLYRRWLISCRSDWLPR